MPQFERASQVQRDRPVFDRFAEALSRVVGRAAFFTIAMALVLVWVPLIWVFESVDTWQLVLNTVTSVIAFLLIALLQNSERRNDDAVQRKLDTIALAVAMQLRPDVDPSRVQRCIAELEAAVGLEQKI